MDLAILSRSPECYSSSSLCEAARQRGHQVRVLDTLKFAIDLRQGEPDLFYNQKHVPHSDAILPRIGASITHFGLAVVRQFEEMDVYCANTSPAIGSGSIPSGIRSPSHITVAETSPPVSSIMTSIWLSSLSPLIDRIPSTMAAEQVKAKRSSNRTN